MNKKENIVNKDIINFKEKNISDYYEEILCNRAVPDVRDSCKPINRKIIYDMYIHKYNSNKKYVKCAKVVGEILGELSPHGMFCYN